MNASSPPRRGRRLVFLGLVGIFAVILSLFALVMPFVTSLADSELRIGEVSAQDILAPYAYTFESQILTEQKREEIVRQVPPVYSPADPGVARARLERLRAALAFISSIRADAYATLKQKQSDLATLEDIQLTQENAVNILALSDTRWQAVQQESIVVLEQVMRNTIRSEQIDTARYSMPALVNLSMSQTQAAIVVELSAAFVAANSFYNDQLTQAAIAEAHQSVTPVKRSFVAGEVIVQRGRAITAVDMEALQVYGLLRTSSPVQRILGAFVLLGVVILYFGMYLTRNPALATDLRALLVVTLLFATFLLAARLVIPGHTILPYVFPLTAYSLVLVTLFGVGMALTTTLPLAILATYGLPNALDLTIFFVLSSFFGVLVLRRAQRVTAFFWSGGIIALSGALVILAYRLPEPGSDWIGLTTLVGAAVLNGLASASISVLLQFLLAQAMGRTTALHLIELSRPDHPLLQFILRNAPGTYQHSLQVASLAEQAAERIGADTLLTRVGALYHDAGKAMNPGFFIENQIAGSLNPHQDLRPDASASTIIRHVNDGLELARKYRLPPSLQAFIAEHHGAMLTRYQYVRAIESAGGDASQVDENLFRYPGPRPQSRETALLMLADGCEARVRAERPKDEQELRALIRSVIDDRVKNRQLDDTGLTLRDLDNIVDSFTANLRGIYHPRIQYPTLEASATPPKAEGTPTGTVLPAPTTPSAELAPPIPSSNAASMDPLNAAPSSPPIKDS